VTTRPARPQDPRRDHVVIIGAGQAGGEAAIALRAAGFDGRVTMVGEESWLPYLRPPLSKAYLLEGAAETVEIRPDETYREHEITVVTGQRAVAIDRESMVVVLADGTRLQYTDAIIATGGRARRLALGSGSPSNLHHIRTREDIDSLRPDLVAGRHLLVIGGGYVGLEIGSVARRLGLEVTVVEAGDRVLGRVAAAPTSDFITAMHRAAGVSIRTSTVVVDAHQDDAGAIVAVTLSSGERLRVDAILVGIGLIPNDDIARECGLDVADGIIVDGDLRTSDPHVFAIGDVARFPAESREGLVRLESTPNASEHARLVAEVLTGTPVSTPAAPWFWTEQFDMKMQSVGLADPTDECVVRGDLDGTGKGCVFYVRAGRVRAADVIASPKDFAMARKLIGVAARPDELADEAVTLRQLAAAVA
jgi:3-phenylpropionate/trans-cinnamate dioxygenase ferredoxin reductase subunit